jgi:hypothetical protein
MAEELRAYENDLLTVRDNIDAVLELESKALETKKAADDLRAMVTNGLVLDFLLKHGLSVEEISQIDSNLNWYSTSIRIAFEQAHALKADVDRMLDEEFALAHQVNRIWWLEFGDQLRAHLREKRAQEQREREQKRAAAPGDDTATPRALNSDQLGTYYGLRTDESKVLNELRALDEEARGASQQDLPKSAARRGELLNRLRDIRKQLEPYGSGPALQ